jgi:alpha-galactosidase
MNNIMLPRLVRAENILDAYRRGDRTVLYLMVAEDPRTRSFDQAKKLVDTLLAQPWNADADKHYR